MKANAKHDALRSKKIEAIRIAACESLGHKRENRCPSCTRAKDAPFKQCDDRGHVIMGCVDAFHHDAFLMGEVNRWYRRPEAQAIRANDLKFLERV